MGMAWLHPMEVLSSGFSHGEKDAQKRGDLTYILYVWDAQLMRPIKKRKGNCQAVVIQKKKYN